MDNSIIVDILDDKESDSEELQDQAVNSEVSYGDLESLNRDLDVKDGLILCINIRSLDHNFDKLQVFVERLKVKPYIIVCVETWDPTNFVCYKLKGYTLYHNNSRINRADGVAVYISDNLVAETVIITENRLKILNTSVKFSNGINLEISSIYRSHDLPSLEFIVNLKTYLNKRKIARII